MSTIRVVNIQHPDSVDPNIVLKTDGTAVFASGITISGSTNLTVSGTAEFASGTAASPKITFIDDNDTGIYSPAANEVAITTNGTERLRVDNTGNVGIGETNPSRLLHVKGSPAIVSRFESTSTNFGGIDLKNANTTADFKVQLAAVGDDLVAFAGGAERMRIDSSGDVGIGTSSPSMLLDVRGTNNPQLKVSATNTGSNSAGLYIENQGQRNWQIWADRSSDQLRIGHASRTNTVVAITDQRVGIGTNSPSDLLNVSGGNLTVQHNTASNFILLKTNVNNGNDSHFLFQKARGGSATPAAVQNNDDLGTISWGGYYGGSYQNNATIRAEADIGGSYGDRLLYDSDMHLIRTGNTTRLAITSSGNVGIGTSSPAAKLNVSSGDIGLSPNADADELFLENTANCGLTIGCGTNQTSNIYFAEQSVGVSRGAIVYDTNGDHMAFSTAGLVNERMRLTSTGNLLCGATSATISTLYTLQVTGSRGAVFKSTGGGANPTQTLWNANSSGDSTLLEFRVNTTDTTVGNIVHDRSAGLVDYNTTSDYRAKTLNGRVENSGSIIDQLKVYNGTMHGATIELPMLVAHEAQEVVPYCVTGEKDAVDSEGNPIYQGMDVSKLVPLLIVEIQELRKRLSDAGL